MAITIPTADPRESGSAFMPQLRAAFDAAYVASGAIYNVTVYGALGDAIEIVDASITSGTPDLESLSSTFTDAEIGKSISVRGAGTAGATLRETIIAVPSPTELTLSGNAVTTVSAEQAVYGTDDLAAFIAAKSAAVAEGGGTVIVPAGFYYLSGQIPCDGTVAFKGTGYSEMSTVGVAALWGSRLYIGFEVATADSLFYVTAQGVEIEGLEFYCTQNQTTALTTPWSIFAYRVPFADVGGDGLKARNLMIRNLSHGIKVSADRCVLDLIYGQPMVLGIYLDGVYDSAKVTRVHWWTYWAGLAVSYTLANCTGLLLGRVDHPSVSDYFAFGCFKGIDFEDSAVGVNPSGYTTKGQFSNIRLDNVHYGIYAGGNGEASFSNLVIYCISGVGDATTGSRGIWIRSTSLAVFQITGGDFFNSDLEAIRADAGFVGWSTVLIRTWNELNNGSTAFYGASGATFNPGPTSADPTLANGGAVYGGTPSLAGFRAPTTPTATGGLGTITPFSHISSLAANLDVTAVGTSRFVLHDTTDPHEVKISLQNAGGVFFDIAGSSTVANNFTAFRVGLTPSAYSGMTEMARINSTGMGIGTSIPAFNANPSTFLAVARSTAGQFGEIGLGGNATGTTDTLGALGFYNSSLATADKRNAAMVGINDGAVNSGKLQFYTWDAGSPGLALTIDKTLLVSVASALVTPIFAVSGLTPGRLPIISTAGLFVTDSDLSWSVDTLTSTKIVGSTSISTPSLIAAANLTAAPVGDWIFNPGGKDVNPAVNYDLNLGALDKKYLTLHAAELWVETLVAQNTIATIGGRILVGPTTVLTSDLAAAGTSIIVKHNQMVSGDRVYMEANGKVEFMAITSGPSGGGPYTYTVTRNLDGSGANDWFAGDAVFNTGTTGNGFMDLYSARGVKAGTELGPTIVGNVRNSTTYNDWSSHWAIGNLDGLYGYSGTAFGAAFGKFSTTSSYITIDSTNGYRAISQNAVRLQISAAGVMTLRDSAGVAKITLDAAAGMTLDGKMQMLGSSSAIAIGVLPPLSAAIGTGLWQDRTGLYGILGVKQVETTTVLGTVTLNGNAAVTVTAASMVGSPYVLNVAVLNGDTATVVAGKVRTALGLDATVTAFFTVSGAGADVILTDLHGRANDATMNLRITNGTCTGLTLADSANTTAGSNTTQAKLDAATGAITAGGGNVVMDALGLSIVSGSGVSNGITWRSSNLPIGSIYSFYASGTASFTVVSSALKASDTTGAAEGRFEITNDVGSGAVFGVRAYGSVRGADPNVAFAYLDQFGSPTFKGFIVGATTTPISMLDVRGTISVGPAFTGVTPGILCRDIAANYSILGFYPQSGTNVNMSFQIFPKGTGQSGNRAQFTVFNTDGVADSANIEYLTFRATGTSFLAASGQEGTGTLRHVIISAGAASSGSPTNSNQLYLATTGNVKLSGSAVRGTTEGTNHLDIFDGTAPVGTLTNGVSLYSASGELRSMDSGGTSTLLSQHASDAPEWMHDDDPTPPNISRETNCFSGIVRFINFTRQARLQQLVFDAEPLPADPQKRKIIHEEKFAEYNARLNLPSSDPRFLVVADWDADQETHRINRIAERAEWSEYKAAWEQYGRENPEKARPFPHPEPQEHVKREKPDWLKRGKNDETGEEENVSTR